MYGFRVDPMKWVQSGTGFEAAKCRTLVFDMAKKGDQGLIATGIDKILAQQQEDGSFGGDPPDELINKTGSAIVDLTALGVPSEHPAIQKAGKFLLASNLREGKNPNIRGLAGVCLAGLGKDPKVQTMLKENNEWVCKELVGRMCPWSESLSLRALYAGRSAFDTQPAIDKILEWANKNINEAGAISYKDSRSFVEFVGHHDDAALKELGMKLIPLMLRDQQPDGGFGDGRSADYLRALKRLGVLEELRQRPPLPPDWEIAREIILDIEEPAGLTWFGDGFWVYSRKEQKLFKISPHDGKVVATLELPYADICGVGRGEGCLLVTRKEAKKLHKVDPTTGETKETIDLKQMEWPGEAVQVKEKIWITDHFMGCFRTCDPATPNKLGWQGIAGAIGNEVCFDGVGVWHIDAWTPTIIRSDMKGKLLDWGEKPFAGRCDGLAWNGSALWALDREGKRICMLKRSNAADAETEEEQTMGLTNVKQPAFNTTLMGVVKAASDVHELGLSDAMVFGLSGHAFVINVHKQLCPSGPYCWKRTEIAPLLNNMGLKETDLGFFSGKNTPQERAVVEAKLRAALDKGFPCSLVNMENQLISAYDETGFDTAQPWPQNKHFPPSRLTFGSWKEFDKEIHVNFYTFEKVKPVDRKAAIVASLDYAVDLHMNPTNHTSEAYGIGPKAYDNWIAAVEKYGDSHGNWWNGVVWGECRRMAADFFDEIGQDDETLAFLCKKLEETYRKLGETLVKVSDKKLPADEKVELLKQAKHQEVLAIAMIKRLAEALRDE